MRLNFTVKSYYFFMFLLPLLFLSGISDLVLLPRQLFLSAFSLLLLGLVWKTTRKDGNSIKIDPVHLAMLIYLLIAATVSFINAKVVSESLYVLSKLWIVMAFSLLTVLLLKNNVITNKHIITAVIIFGCVSIATALTDFYKTTLPGQHLFRRIQDVSGGFANKNLLSSILFLCLPFFMIGMREKRRLRITSYVALVLTLFILVMLRTRIVLIATFVFFAIIAFFYLKEHLRRKVWLFMGASFSIVAILFFALSSFGVFGKLQSPTDAVTRYFNRLLATNTLDERLLFWQNSLEMFREYPFGVGLGNWQIYFPKYGLAEFELFQIVNGVNTLQRPHNDFLWSLCETGVFGFAAYMTIFGVIIYKSLRLIKAAPDKHERWMFIYLVSGVFGFMMISFFDFPMERIEHQIVLMLLFALIIHQYGIKIKDSFAFPLKKIFVMVFVVFGVGFSLIVAFGRLAAERDVYKMYAARTNQNADEVLSFAEHADSFLYKIDSKTMPLEWYKGVAKFSKQQYAESEVCFQNAYDLTPYNIHVINNLASCYEINGKRKDAIEFYLKALRISPMFEEARLNLAAVYFNDKKFEKAFQTFDSCDVNSSDSKYKLFLPAILKAKVDLIFSRRDFKVSDESRKTSRDVQYYLPAYYESKKNNITFEKQIINDLMK